MARSIKFNFWRRRYVFLFFLSFLFIGLSIFKDYGVHWDEVFHQERGNRWGRYVIDFMSKGFNVPLKVESYDFHHGVTFQLFLTFLRYIFKLSDSRDIILMRHLATFLTFYIGVFFFYLLCTLHFKSWKMSLLGTLFLIAHPRIFAHSFYNSADIPFLSLYAISMYTLITYLENKTFLRANLHAIACAILVGIRLAGLIVPLCTFVFISVELLRFRRDKEEIKKIVKSFLIYIISLIIFTILFWPLLWKNPVKNFFLALQNFQSNQSGFILYFPDLVKQRIVEIYYTTSLWNYNFRWIIITTPLLYVFYFFVGLLIYIASFLRNPVKFYCCNRNMLIAIFLFFIPIILSIVYKTSLFDEWRHHYFVYPAFVMISLAGMSSLFQFAKSKFQGLTYKIINTALIAITAFSLINVIWFMVRYHPYQYVYGNILAGREMNRAKCDLALDYWGLSYGQALEYILKNDKDRIIKICVATPPGRFNAYIIPPEERKRLIYVDDLNNAKYFLSNYRWQKEEYPFKNEYYSIKVNGIKIMVVYKL